MQKYNLLGTVHVITGYVDGTFTRKLSGSTGAMTIEDLINKSDYIALGHIHQEYKNEEKKYFTLSYGIS